MKIQKPGISKLLFAMLILLNSCILREKEIDTSIVTCNPCESPLAYDGYTLAFNDEFDGNQLSDVWSSNLGDGCPENCGWGNNELQSYQMENTAIVNGNLVITAKKENVGGSGFTSSRINTKGIKTFQFGRIDVRAKLPKGKGMWPAFWLIGANIDSVGYPESGQINIAEMVGGNADGQDNAVYGTIYYDNNGSLGYEAKTKRISDEIFNDRFHVFSIVWGQNKIEWLLNDVPYFEADITPAGRDAFKKPFFMIINLAVGGDWPGAPDQTTVFPQELEVDYIRYFRKN